MSDEMISFTASERAVIRSKYAALTEDEFGAFLSACSRYRLNPLANQIYARLQPKTERSPRSIGYVAQIDGYRLIADRTGQYAGNDDPEYDNELSPKKASVTVYKLVGGVRCPFTATARWDQYYPGDRQGFMWKKMPHLMLGKCAEALALRKAFPAELAGLYTDVEMHQAGDAAEASATTVVAEAPAPKAAPAKKPPVRPAGEQIKAAKTPQLLVSMVNQWHQQKPIGDDPAWWERVVKATEDKYNDSGWGPPDSDELVDLITSLKSGLETCRQGAEAF